jgi:hypothetical protein
MCSLRKGALWFVRTLSKRGRKERREDTIASVITARPYVVRQASYLLP